MLAEICKLRVSQGKEIENVVAVVEKIVHCKVNLFFWTIVLTTVSKIEHKGLWVLLDEYAGEDHLDPKVVTSFAAVVVTTAIQKKPKRNADVNSSGAAKWCVKPVSTKHKWIFVNKLKKLISSLNANSFCRRCFSLSRGFGPYFSFYLLCEQKQRFA